MKSIAAMLFLASAAVAAGAADEPKTAPASKDNFFARAMKTIGNDAKTGFREAKKDLTKTGKDIKSGTSKAASEIGSGMKSSAAKTKEAAKETFK